MKKLFVLFVMIIALTACANNVRTIGDIKDIDFEKLDGIRIRTTEQVLEYPACQRYEVREKKQLVDFIKMMKESQKIGNMDTPFPRGDGVIGLLAEGAPHYAFRYYMDENQLLDLQKGVLYQFPEGLTETLNNLEPYEVNSCGVRNNGTISRLHWKL